MFRRGVVLLFAVLGLAFAAAPAQAIDQTTVTIQSAVLLDEFRVQVTGTATCNEGELVFSEAVVRQLGPGRTTIEGVGQTGGLSCPAGGSLTWTVVATGNGVFNPGRASIDAFATVCNSSCVSDRDVREVRLRRARA